MNDYQIFIAISRYARWLEEEGRRETWDETVLRYLDNVVKPRWPEDSFEYEYLKRMLSNLWHKILNHEVMPSMRGMMTAGPALLRDNTCGYNCSYLEISDTRAFDEAMFILLCGTGVGFSVERQFISQLPEVPNFWPEASNYWQVAEFEKPMIVVEDSKEGWATALRELLEHLYAGRIPEWDVSKVRPAGSRLKTFGGRASGPEPLVELFHFVIETFYRAQGRRLNSIECHDIMCKIGEIVVVGGVRRSAMISLSNLSDNRMRQAKMGNWYEHEKQRGLSNNSIAYTEKPDAESFLREWTALVESKSGERGIFNRTASVNQSKKYGRRSVITPEGEVINFGTNPCSEIILRPFQFCNLTEIVARKDDDYDTLKEKVELATILGTIQASYTYFPYLRDIWRKNTEEEALLGVSITGIMDCQWLRECSEEDLDELRKHAVEVNKLWAEALGIKPAAAITCVKPSGTVSQLTDSSSGIHTRHSDYYIRTVRGDNKDPLTQFLTWSGVPAEPDFMKPDNTTVFSFPMKAPEGAVTRNDMTAIEQLEFWLKFQRGWCEHKPSITVTVRDDEWVDVGAFVYKHFDEISGISFLPHSDHVYAQAPYQEISKEQYEEALEKMPTKIQWELLSEFELEDTTSGSQTLACSAGACEIVDI